MDRERCRKRPGRGRIALRGPAGVRARDVMVNLGTDSLPQSLKMLINRSQQLFFLLRSVYTRFDLVFYSTNAP